MATVGRRGKYRVWQQDDTDGTNANLLIAPTSRSSESVAGKPSRCIGFCPFFMLLLGACLAFLLGICLGYYVRESQKFDDDISTCGTSRLDSFAPTKLASIHENIMYFMSGQKIREFVRRFGHRGEPQTGSVLEQRLERAVKRRFEELQLDSVTVEEHRVLTTVPRSDRPNTLELLSATGTAVSSFQLTNGDQGARASRRGNSEDGHLFPIVAFSPAGTAEGGLLYGHYGSQADLQVLQTSLGTELTGNLLLLRLGRIPLSDKLSNAAAAGAVGVLLYWDPDDLTDPGYVFNASHVPQEAARPADLRSGSLARLPAQTVSREQAQALLQRLGGPSLAAWRGGMAPQYNLGGLHGNMTVRLTTFNKIKEKTVRNVIGNLQGFTERDHYVLVGAPRSWLAGGGGDSVVSTGILLQLAQSLSHVRLMEQWKPRRGIKLCSWGGAELGHLGMAFHIQSHHQVLQDRAIAYVDLSQLVLGNASMVAMTTAALHHFLNEASYRVPDPNDAAYSVHDLASVSAKAGFKQIPNLGYPGNPDNFLFLHSLGVPVLKLQHVPALQNESSVTGMEGLDEQHHYKYHIGVMRVLTLALLGQADSLVLPYSVKDYAHDIHLSVWQSSQALQDCSQDTEHMEDQEALTDSLVDAGNAFREYIQTSLKNNDAQSVRMINDAKLLFERTLITQSQRAVHHVLYPMSQDGVMLSVQEACVLGQVTKNWTAAHRVAEQLQQHLDQALESLRMAN